MHEDELNFEELEMLLERAAAGEDVAFAELFSRHRDYLVKVVSIRMDQGLRRRVDPEDIVQDAYAEAYRRFGDYMQRRPMAFRLWLRLTAIEQLQMQIRFHRRSAKRDVGREVGLPDESVFALVERLFAVGSSPSQRAEKAEMGRQVREALTLLSEADREILLLRNLEGLSNQEAAEVLEIEPVAASQRYVRALKRLKQVLTDSGLLGGEP